MAKDKSYNQLRKEWYAKLKAKGFDDIETAGGRLHNYDSSQFHNKSFSYTPEQMDLIRDHYMQAEQLLHSFAFKDKTHKLIWALYCEGKTLTEIVTALKRPGYRALSKPWIGKIIQQYKQYLG